MPFPLPVALMIVLALLAPISDSDLPMTTPSRYFPCAAWIASPGLAAATAAVTVLKQPLLPGFTHSVAAAANWEFPAISVAPAAISNTHDQVLVFIATLPCSYLRSTAIIRPHRRELTKKIVHLGQG